MRLHFPTRCMPTTRLRSGSKRGRAALAGTALLCGLTQIAACSAPESRSAASAFVIATADGDVVGDVHGSARGLTNAGLARLIAAGVAERYPVRCATVPLSTQAIYRMDWRVTDEGRTPVAVLSAQIDKNGKAFRSAFLKIVAPAAAPDNVFMHDVAALSAKLLPPGSGPGPKFGQCP